MKNKAKKSDTFLTLYLADPVHNYIGGWDNRMIPLGVLNIAAYTQAALGERAHIRVMKFADEIFRAIDEEPADIIGVSNYLWNAELSKEILRYAKRRSPETVTVMGGPNVVLEEDCMTRFMEEAACDYYVPDAGESVFRGLVLSALEAKLSGGGMSALHQEKSVEGIWYRDRAKGRSGTKPIVERIKDLDEIPSPFVSGLADVFFEQGFSPMVETSRGCPHSCTFCVWGLGHHVFCHSVEYVKRDLEWCSRKAKGGMLMLNDAIFSALIKGVCLRKEGIVIRLLLF